MKKQLIGLFAMLGILLLASAATPTRVRKADQAEWLKYSAWCRTMVPDTVQQVGYYSGSTMKITNGDTVYYNVENPDTVWFNYQKPDYQQNSLRKKNLTYYIPDKKVALIRNKICTVQRRRTSVRDFYEWWMVPGDKYFTTGGYTVTVVQKLEIKN